MDPTPTALITGAGSGIGAATARRLARDGTRVVAMDRDEEAVHATCAGIEAQRGRAIPVVGDIACAVDRLHAIDRVGQRFGRLDVVVNNAGIMRNAQLHKMPPDVWEDVVEVDLIGPMALVDLALPLLERSSSASVVNVASRALLGGFGQTNYAAAKAGLLGLRRSLAVQLGARGIRVNAVAPGFIETAITSGTPDDARERIRAAVPLGRLGTPADVADAVAFLASPAASYVTGQCLFVCGGRSLLGSLDPSAGSQARTRAGAAEGGPA